MNHQTVISWIQNFKFNIPFVDFNLIFFICIGILIAFIAYVVLSIVHDINKLPTMTKQKSKIKEVKYIKRFVDSSNNVLLEHSWDSSWGEWIFMTNTPGIGTTLKFANNDRSKLITSKIIDCMIDYESYKTATEDCVCVLITIDVISEIEIK